MIFIMYRKRKQQKEFELETTDPRRLPMTESINLDDKAKGYYNLMTMSQVQSPTSEAGNSSGPRTIISAGTATVVNDQSVYNTSPPTSPTFHHEPIKPYFAEDGLNRVKPDGDCWFWSALICFSVLFIMPIRKKGSRPGAPPWWSAKHFLRLVAEFAEPSFLKSGIWNIWQHFWWFCMNMKLSYPPFLLFFPLALNRTPTMSLIDDFMESSDLDPLHSLLPHFGDQFTSSNGHTNGDMMRVRTRK